MSEPSRTVRRLRVALVGVSMLCALLVLVTIAAVVYWRLYLEQPTPGPFERRPYVVRLGPTSAAAQVADRRAGRAAGGGAGRLVVHARATAGSTAWSPASATAGRRRSAG